MMQLFSRILLVMCICSAALQAEAVQIPRVNVGLNDIIAAVEAPFRFDRGGNPELESVRADFFQRSTIAAKKTEQRADGEMYLRPASSSQPIKFRFDYFRPARQEVVCDGRTLWVYLPEIRQVIVSDVAEFFDPYRYDPLRDRATNFLQGLGRISKDFTITFAERSMDMDGNYILELRPLRASPMVERLFLTVSRDAVLDRLGGGRPVTNAPSLAKQEKRLFAILATTVIDHDGNSTTMEFSNIKANEMLPEALFSFDIPSFARVVRPATGK